MCHPQLNEFLADKKNVVEDFCVTNLNYTINQFDDVILFECPLCCCYKTQAYIFICGCRYVGLMCINCLNWLDEHIIFYCSCFDYGNYELLPLRKERVLPLLQQRKLYLIQSDPLNA